MKKNSSFVQEKRVWHFRFLPVYVVSVRGMVKLESIQVSNHLQKLDDIHEVLHKWKFRAAVSDAHGTQPLCMLLSSLQHRGPRDALAASVPPLHPRLS